MLSVDAFEDPQTRQSYFRAEIALDPAGLDRLGGVQVLPGMPVGSPGMEVEGVDAPAYTVLALNRDGSTTPYAEHSP